MQFVGGASGAGVASESPACAIMLYSDPGSVTTSGLDRGEAVSEARGGEKQYGDRLCTYGARFGVVMW